MSYLRGAHALVPQGTYTVTPRAALIRITVWLEINRWKIKIKINVIFVSKNAISFLFLFAFFFFFGTSRYDRILTLKYVKRYVSIEILGFLIAKLRTCDNESLA